ncbi:hypothetical protein BDB01DRAFT_726815 [Pilobolus umbonatus]|nr:hypothetical protein BDB01DRAFT_726815 [Pilobolus umbonatus]
MTSYGTSVNEDNVQEVIESTGKNEYIVFCYDRQYLEANPEQISTLLDVETPKLESKPATFDGNISLKALQKLLGKQSATQTCDAYLTLFGNFDAYSQSLMKIITHHMQLARQIVEEQKLQSMAINVAMTNLETHNKKKQQCIQPFITNAERELNRQNNLLSSVHNDIEILRHIHVHPDIMSIMDTDKVSLLDYIDLHYIETVRKDTLLISDYLSSEINELRAMSASLDQSEKELQAHVEDNNDLHSLDTLLIDIQEIQQKAQFLRDKIKRDLHRIYGKISGLLNIPLSSLSSSSIQSVTMETSNAQSKKLFETFNHLADIHIKDYMPKLFKYEITIRQRVTELTNSKRRSIQIFTEHMNEVSTIQNDIASVPPRIEKAEDALLQFKQKYGLNDLVIVRDILFSYGALMIELVRRKEYTHLLRNNADLLSDLMSTYRNEEEKRREYFRHKIMRSLPFKLKIADTPSSQCEINTRHTTEPITITMQKQDIIDFISLLRQVYSPVPSPINRPSYSVFNAKPLESSNKSVLSSRMFGKLGDQEENKFLGLLDTMLKDLNNLKLDFLKTMETTCKVL